MLFKEFSGGDSWKVLCNPTSRIYHGHFPRIPSSAPNCETTFAFCKYSRSEVNNVDTSSPSLLCRIELSILIIRLFIRWHVSFGMPYSFLLNTVQRQYEYFSEKYKTERIGVLFATDGLHPCRRWGGRAYKMKLVSKSILTVVRAKR